MRRLRATALAGAGVLLCSVLVLYGRHSLAPVSLKAVHPSPAPQPCSARTRALSFTGGDAFRQRGAVLERLGRGSMFGLVGVLCRAQFFRSEDDGCRRICAGEC